MKDYKKNSLYKTSDLSLAAFMITKEYKIDKCSKEGSSVYFEFWISDNDNPLSDYLAGDLVSAKEYASNIKQIKSMAMKYGK